jgi:outer membrane protein OmpA-like peptidoglycan-associated protein
MRGLLVLLASGCSILPTSKEAFPTVEITAKRPPPTERAVLLPSTIVISDKVQFEVSSADLKPASYALLDDVVTVMKANPQIEIVHVEGHTDSTGEADFNTALSQKRAESVVKYIASKGVDASRLTAKGFGPEKPIADNADAAGQEMNRRVEFIIVERTQPNLDECYQIALARNRKLGGGFFHVDAVVEGGQFKDVVVRRDEIQDPAVRQCVMMAVRQRKLGKTGTMSFAYHFTPTN